jgi:hypothetical protein
MKMAKPNLTLWKKIMIYYSIFAFLAVLLTIVFLDVKRQSVWYAETEHMEYNLLAILIISALVSVFAVGWILYFRKSIADFGWKRILILLCGLGMTACLLIPPFNLIETEKVWWYDGKRRTDGSQTQEFFGWAFLWNPPQTIFWDKKSQYAEFKIATDVLLIEIAIIIILTGTLFFCITPRKWQGTERLK